MGSSSPETRASLLVRLHDRADQDAWHEFTEIYRPVIFRLACRRGLQHADAEDLAQQVLLAVARAIDRWQPDPARARFRTWLHTIAQRLIINALSRGPPDRGTGDSGMLDLLEQQPAADGAASELLRSEYQREVFRRAARQIRGEFQADTWRAFWETAVEGRSADEVAAALGKSCGAIYAARSRVMRRLKDKVAEIAPPS
jgi:RNA polymerase sigma-70 factor (ECF subfamily)